MASAVRSIKPLTRLSWQTFVFSSRSTWVIVSSCNFSYAAFRLSDSSQSPEKRSPGSTSGVGAEAGEVAGPIVAGWLAGGGSDAGVLGDWDRTTPGQAHARIAQATENFMRNGLIG